MKKTTETQLVKACLDYLSMRGIMAWRNNSGAFASEHKGRKRFVRFGTPGAPDIMGILPPADGGRFLGIECKVGKNKQTPAQHAWAFQCERSGGLYVLARSVDDVHDALKVIE